VTATPVTLALWWHQHQPSYFDPISGRFVLPWVRLHAIKDYYGMARLMNVGIQQLRDAVFARVAQRALRALALQTFRHIHAMSMRYHITRTTGGLIVLPKSHHLYRRYAADWKQIARIGASACDQCSFCTEFCPRFLLGHPIEPHKAMRSLCFNEMGEANVIGTDFCCECNLCTMIACPEDLDPKNVCTHNKRRRAAEQVRWDNPPLVEARAELHLDSRRVPIGRLIRKLGLSDFKNVGPLIDPAPPPARVTIPLRMHIGAPAEPMVSVGQTVRTGEVIAAPPSGKLGVPLHASIDGNVVSVDEVIVIEHF